MKKVRAKTSMILWVHTEKPYGSVIKAGLVQLLKPD